MACIWKHPKSKYWIARFLSADGEYKNRSTKETDSKKARKTAEDWEKVERVARRGVLVEAQAREVLNEILERATGDRLQTHSCREWLEEWVKGKQGTTAAKTMLKYSQVARDFLKYLGKRADLPLTAISIQDFRSYRDKLAEGGRSPQTVNQLLHKTLTIPFNKARRFGLIPMNPLVAVESLTEDPGERDIFTTEQIASLLEVARDDWRGVILAGFYTGLRLIDITNLKWSNIDVATGCITLYAQKSKRTKRKIIIPIHDDLADWLSSRPSSDVDGSIFLRSPGRPLAEAAAFRGSSGRSWKKPELRDGSFDTARAPADVSKASPFTACATLSTVRSQTQGSARSCARRSPDMLPQEIMSATPTGRSAFCEPRLNRSAYQVVGLVEV